MRRQAFTLVEIMIVVLIIGILLMVAVPSWMKIRQTSQQNACEENLRVIRDAKIQWGMDHGMTTSATPTEADLSPEYIKTWPVCPQHGTYVIGNMDAEVTCPIHGSSSSHATTP